VTECEDRAGHLGRNGRTRLRPFGKWRPPTPCLSLPPRRAPVAPAPMRLPRCTRSNWSRYQCDTKPTSHHLARKELALIDGGNAQTIQEFETDNRAVPPSWHPCAMSRLLATGYSKFPMVVRNGVQLRLASTAQSRSSTDPASTAIARRRSGLQPARAPRSTDRAANLLTGMRLVSSLACLEAIVGVEELLAAQGAGTNRGHRQRPFK